MKFNIRTNLDRKSSRDKAVLHQDIQKISFKPLNLVHQHHQSMITKLNTRNK